VHQQVTAPVNQAPHAPLPSPVPQPSTPDPSTPALTYTPGHHGPGSTKGLAAVRSSTSDPNTATAIGAVTRRAATVAGETAGLPATSPD
jgi:hypothetical protein